MKKLFYLCFFLSFFFFFSCENKNEIVEIKKPPNVGEQILEARSRAGISQKELADVLGLSLYNIKIIEKGKAIPTRDIIVEIEERLGIEITLDNI